MAMIRQRGDREVAGRQGVPSHRRPRAVPSVPPNGSQSGPSRVAGHQRQRPRGRATSLDAVRGR